MINTSRPSTGASFGVRSRFALLRLIESGVFNRFVMVLVVADLLPFVMPSVRHNGADWWPFLWLSHLSFVVFLLEYVVRIVVAPEVVHYRKRVYKTRWGYLFSFYGAIDLLSILPFILPNYIDLVHANVHQTIALVRFILIFKLIRYSTSFRMVMQAVKLVRTELITVFSAAIMTVLFSAILMFYAEHTAQPDKFSSLFDGVWWAVITFATVGYGDIYPVTALGKAIACMVSMLGIAMIALPSGIIGSSFRQVMADHHKEQLQQEVQSEHEKLLDKLNSIERKLDALSGEKQQGKTEKE